MKRRLAIGTMTGTSMDGVDVALIRSDGDRAVESLGHVHLPYESDFAMVLKQAAASQVASNGMATLDSDLQDELTQYHIRAIDLLLAKTAVDLDAIAAIGFHGQTLFHQPAIKKTLQVGDAALLKQHFQVPIVHQFRQSDVALGGQGAPLAPIYHYALAMRDALAPVAVINCGGIVNATLVGCDEASLEASDLGPGMCLLDRYIQTLTQGEKRYDENGQLSEAGHVSQPLYEALRQANPEPPLWPKSFDVGEFVIPDSLYNKSVSLKDGMATLAYYGAIVNAIALLKQVKLRDISLSRAILVGGGWKNQGFKNAFAAMLEGVDLIESVDIGWNAQAIEAECFAYLALRCLDNKPSSWPATTGVPKACVNGRV